MADLNAMGTRARFAAFSLSQALSGEKNEALHAIAAALEKDIGAILTANKQDLRDAEQNGMSAAMVDRLRLTSPRIQEMAAALRFVAGLDDPVGKVIGGETRPNGLQIVKTTVPLGVVGIIYESRPNVTVDCAALCLKSGNACILRGGSEAKNSNTTLVRIIHEALAKTSIEPDCVQLLEDTSREAVNEMMRLNGFIDVLIPRGGAGLIQAVVRGATVPVIETGAGNCHIYVDASADEEMAVNIVNNAKTSRPSVCNAMETLLIHEDCAMALLPKIAEKLLESQVELRCCQRSREIIGDAAQPVTDADYWTEFDDYILAVRIVDNIDEAIRHISAYSTHHSEAIITRDYNNAQRFLAQVDSAAVYVNASTRFTDGGEFGLGAEIGISTQRLHARGPMGLAQMVSSKYIITGNGQIR